MKNSFLLRVTLLVAFFSLLVLPVAHAAGVISEGAQMTEEAAFGAKTTEKTKISSIVGTIIRAFLSLLGTIFLVLLLYGGFLWMTAGGNEEQIEKAKKMIRNAVIGLLIILSAYAIQFFVIDVFIVSTGQDV